MAKFAFLFFLACFACGHAKSLSKTAEEIEEYSEFLRKSVVGKPLSPAIPELNDLQNEWEKSGKFEGDIVLTEEQREAMVAEFAGSRNALTSTRRLWPDGIVYYRISSLSFTPEQEVAIRDALDEMEELSCLKFVERTTEIDYILITGRDDGCYATVGYLGLVQILNLTPNTPGLGCFRHGVIIHEFLHSLGFYHMQSTYNRDDYVEIIWENIRPGTENNFNKYTDSQVTNLGEEYDYGSVMHYSLYGFSVNGGRTIEPLQDTGDIDIGQTIGMSDSDIVRLNRLYNCPAH